MKSKKLIVTFCSFPDYSSNAKPLYQYMKKRYKDAMRFVWIVRTDEGYNELKRQNIEVYKIYSKEYYDIMKKTNVVISTHGDLLNEKEKCCLYIDLWHGIGIKKGGYLLHDISDYDKKWFNNYSRKVDYMIVPTDFWATIFSASFYVENERILKLGYPKLDEFIKKNPKEKLSKVLDIDVNEYDKIIFYMPTFKKGVGRIEKNGNFRNLIDIVPYDEEQLLNYLKEKNYLLCIKYHPSEELSAQDVSYNNVKIIKDDKLFKEQITVNEILNASDCLISDYSSLAVEYVFLNKPVILLNTNIKKFEKHRGIFFENYDLWVTGPCTDNIADLKTCLDKALNDFNPNDSLYQSRRELWFGKLKNGGCQQICDYIFENNQISNRVKCHVDLEMELEEAQKELNIKQQQIESQKAIIDEKNKELNMVYNSRGWKLLEKLRKVKRGKAD